MVDEKNKKIIGIEKFDNTKMLIDTDDKLPEDITLKIVVIFMTSVKKDNGNMYPQLILQEALLEALKVAAAFYSLNFTIKLD